MDSTSPWDVDNIEDFLHYCCPQCDVKNKSKSDFLLHAQYQHPDSTAYLCKYHVKSEVEIIDKENSGLEFNKCEQETVDLESENELVVVYKQELKIEEETEEKLTESSTSIVVTDEIPKIRFSGPKNGTNIEIGEKTMQESSKQVSEYIMCNLCEIPKPFTDSQKFKNHQKRCHGMENDKSKYSKYFIIEEKLISCRKCQGTFSKDKQISGIKLMKKHMKDHGLTFDNDKDDIKLMDFENNEMNAQPKKDGIELFKYKCDICKFAHFDEESLLKIHVRVNHTEYNKENKCYVCAKIFPSKGGLTRHIYKVHEKIGQNCDYCGKAYIQSEALKVHISNVHKLGPKEHECELCQKSYRTLTQLNSHKRVHIEEEQTCDKCGKVVKSQRHLYIHLKIHTGIKPHRCDLCQKQFIKKNTLTLHIQKVHEKRRDFLCTQCAAEFGWKEDLKRHITTGELLF